MIAAVEPRIELPSGYNIVGVESVMRPLPPVRWICQSIRLAAGAPTLVAGYGYSGKSLAMQSLCLSVASGRALWGRFGVSRGSVLHLDYEQGSRITFDRYQRMSLAMGLDEGDLRGMLDVGVLPTCGLSLDALKRLGCGRTLIVVDSWRAAHPRIDENDSGVRGSLDAMTLASEVTGCCFVVLHHARKPQKDSEGGQKMSIRGSSGFFDGCQTIYLFDGRDVGRPVVTLEKDRIGGQALEPFALVVRDLPGGGLEVRHEAEQPPAKPSADERFADLTRAVLEFLTSNPGCSASVIAERIDRRKGSVLAVVQSLSAEGKLIKSGSGTSSRYHVRPGGQENGAGAGVVSKNHSPVPSVPF